MFGKLMKYDMRSVFKYWWIAAVSSAVLSLFGGFCIQIVKVTNTSLHFLKVFAVIGLVLVGIGLLIFAVLSEILILARFYKHFFTDEGYLTFTLPVRKYTLLNSKLLMSVLFQFFTLLTLGLDAFIIAATGIPEELFSNNVFHFLWRMIRELFTALNGYVAVYAFEFLLLIIIASVMMLLMFYICLTFAAMIAGKHKVIVGIALYYAAVAVISTAAQILISMGYYRVFEWISELENYGLPIFAALFLGIVTVFGIVTAGLYMLEVHLLDRHLNLQ